MCIKTFWGWREDFQWRHPTRKYKQRRGEERRGSQERLVSRKLSQTHWTQIALCEHRTQVSCYTGMHCMPCSVPDSIYNVYNVQMYISTTVAQTCREAETSPSTLQMIARPPKNWNWDQIVRRINSKWKQLNENFSEPASMVKNPSCKHYELKSTLLGSNN